MFKVATIPMLAAMVLAAPLLTGSVTAASAADKGLISIIVIDPANLYWLTEGKVAAAEAEKLATATVGATKGDTNMESKLMDTAITNQSVAIIMDPADASGSIGAVKRGIAAGIPVSVSTPKSMKRACAGATRLKSAQGTALGGKRWVKMVGEKGKRLGF